MSVKIKKGISLVVLVITIIVMIILTGFVIAMTTNIIPSSREASFLSDLSILEDKIKEYYTNTGALPIKENTHFTLTALRNDYISSTKVGSFDAEVTKNQDNDNEFNLLDLDAIGVTDNERGNGETNDDIYVFSTNTLNVYYLAGVKGRNGTVFSLANETEGNTVVLPVPTSQEPVDLTNSIKLSKDTYLWSNSVTINIDASLASGESLQYYIAGVISNMKTLTTNHNEIIINADTLTSEEKTAFSTNPTNKKIVAQKLREGAVLTDTLTEISIDNLDYTVPLINVQASVTSTISSNSLQITATDSESGVKYIAYDYFTKVDGDNRVINYYEDGTEINQSRLLTSGMKNTTLAIILPKNIKSIKAMAIDKAGNCSSVTTFEIDNAYIVGN